MGEIKNRADNVLRTCLAAVAALLLAATFGMSRESFAQTAHDSSNTEIQCNSGTEKCTKWICKKGAEICAQEPCKCG